MGRTSHCPALGCVRSLTGGLTALPVVPLEQLWSAEGVAFRYFDLGATFLWATSGAVLAARRGYDLTGIFAIALVSSCGGGLLRDALFLQAGPPIIVRTPSYVILALVASLLVWGLGEKLQGRVPPPIVQLTIVADALGLGAFAVVGMRLALAASIGVAGAVLVGVVNAVGGGILRSLLLHRTPEVFRPGQLTAIAALVGALFYAGLALGLRVDEDAAGVSAMLLAAGVNWASRRFRFQTRPAWSTAARRRSMRGGKP
jgi:uncharacterized membrane protein YeiH